MNEYEGKIILWSSSAGHRSPTSYEKTFLARAKHEGQLFFSIMVVQPREKPDPACFEQ